MVAHSLTRSKAGLEIDLNPLYRHGLDGLEEALKNYPRDIGQNICQNCNIQRTIVTNYGAHLFIDIEALQWEHAAKGNGYVKDYKTKFSVTDIPHVLKCGTGLYKLVGAVEHIDATDEENMHYRALILRNPGVMSYWQIHDGLTPTAKVYNMKQKHLQEERSIHILFYIDSNPPMP